MIVRSGKKRLRVSVWALLLFMLTIFCVPFTIFEEANAYLADTESQLVHYYLTPLPDNGEACAEIPTIVFSPVKTAVKTQVFSMPLILLATPFFHPPR